MTCAITMSSSKPTVTDAGGFLESQRMQTLLPAQTAYAGMGHTVLDAPRDRFMYENYSRSTQLAAEYSGLRLNTTSEPLEINHSGEPAIDQECDQLGNVITCQSSPGSPLDRVPTTFADKDLADQFDRRCKLALEAQISPAPDCVVDLLESGEVSEDGDVSEDVLKCSDLSGSCTPISSGRLSPSPVAPDSVSTQTAPRSTRAPIYAPELKAQPLPQPPNKPNKKQKRKKKTMAGAGMGYCDTACADVSFGGMSPSLSAYGTLRYAPDRIGSVNGKQAMRKTACRAFPLVSAGPVSSPMNHPMVNFPVMQPSAPAMRLPDAARCHPASADTILASMVLPPRNMCEWVQERPPVPGASSRLVPNMQAYRWSAPAAAEVVQQDMTAMEPDLLGLLLQQLQDQQQVQQQQAQQQQQLELLLQQLSSQSGVPSPTEPIGMGPWSLTPDISGADLATLLQQDSGAMYQERHPSGNGTVPEQMPWWAAGWSTGSSSADECIGNVGNGGFCAGNGAGLLNDLAAVQSFM